MVRRSHYVVALTCLLIIGYLSSGLIPQDDVAAVSSQAARLKSWVAPEDSVEFAANDSSPVESVLSSPQAKHLNWTKVATMIETRDSPMLIPILLSWLSIVPLDWPFVVWTGAENHNLLANAPCFRDEIESGRLNFTRVDGPGSPYRPNPELTSTLSDALANSNWFWTQFQPEAEWMLFFQVDSVLCSRSNQTVDDWLGYDFVGGPSNWSHGKGMDRLGGNGGLSMRRISSSLKVTTESPRLPGQDPEDVWFTRKFKDMEGTRFPEPEGRATAAFSMSQGWLEDASLDFAWKPLGVHHGSMHMGEALEPASNGLISDYQHRMIQSCPEFLFLRYAIDEFRELNAQGRIEKSGGGKGSDDASTFAEDESIMHELSTTVSRLQDMVANIRGSGRSME